MLGVRYRPTDGCKATLCLKDWYIQADELVRCYTIKNESKFLVVDLNPVVGLTGIQNTFVLAILN